MELKETKLMINGNIGIITLDNPKTMNAITIQVIDEVIDSLDVLDKDNNVKVIVITGTDKSFSSGGDIRHFAGLLAKGKTLPTEGIENIGKMIMKIRTTLKPCIAALNGVVAGAGCSVALACDFRIIPDTEKIVEAFINLALCGDSGNLYLLNKMVGSARTTEIMMLGKTLSADEAKNLGLVNKVVKREDFSDTVNKFALRLANGPLFAYAKQKDLINKINFGNDFEEYLAIEAKYMKESSMTEDFKEGVQSFIEKRAPKFIGE
ncbi:enoyl-CoA hydratase/isomerase family protein [Vibrio sp. VB16]|uniref:enoyl-CoA hydratase/isomerase family protein n=1 Tax=Vibrio sp. VB16 TaxID=2785746 RepID=UPI00189C71A2|nr:enoyl-CoA hydratase-related protein [Vibrio sp. VB16]UGA53663.1 enoyl-CoA hydratase-related protein [Vibrio sp. VB16]